MYRNFAGPPWRRLIVAFGPLLLAASAVSCGDDPVAPGSNALRPSFTVGSDPTTGATIETDKDDYFPGETVQIVGTGWGAGESVHLRLTRDPRTSPDDEWDVTADGDGSFATSFPVVDSDLGVTFTMTSTGAVSGSVTKVVFTDGIPGTSATALSITQSQAPDPLVVGSSGPYAATYQVTLAFEGNGTHCTVALSAISTGSPAWPSGSSFSFSPAQVTGWGGSSPSGPQVSTLTVSVPSGTGPATYNFSAGITYPPGHGCQNTNGNPTTTGTLVVQAAAPANSPPVLGTIGNRTVNEGQELAFTASATDDPGQTLSFSLVGAPAGATINSTTGAFSWTPADGPSSATFKVRVTDDGSPSMSAEEEITVTVINVAPTATFGAESPVDEGTPFSLSLTDASDVAADLSTLEYAFDCGNGYGAYGGSASASCPTDDNGSRSVKGKVRDKDGGETEYTATVTIDNVDPTINAFTISPDLLQVGGSVTLTVSFGDPGTADTHTATSSCGGSAGPTVAGATSLTLPCTFSATGVYPVTVTVTDDDGGSDTEEYVGYVVVYDPSGGFVTGGGWIDSPVGAYVPDPDLSGKATFGFVSKYDKGKTVPSGNTEFVFHAAGMNFKSTSYEWLVVSGARAQYKGEGTLNGLPGYGFLLTAMDGELNGGGGMDRFRMKVWEKSSGNLVYDNQPGVLDTADPTTVLGGGSIVIHSGGNGKNK